MVYSKGLSTQPCDEPALSVRVDDLLSPMISLSWILWTVGDQRGNLEILDLGTGTIVADFRQWATMAGRG